MSDDSNGRRRRPSAFSVGEEKPVQPGPQTRTPRSPASFEDNVVLTPDAEDPFRETTLAVEALTPDFAGSERDIATVVASGVDVFAQNLETVERLTHVVRDPRAGYAQTLDALACAKRLSPALLTKTSLMLGLGETDDEIVQAIDDIRAAGVDILTFGQYLRPTRNHLPVVRYVTPAEFERCRRLGLDRGFLEVVAGPLVRSSYRAERVFEKNNVGL